MSRDKLDLGIAGIVGVVLWRFGAAEALAVGIVLWVLLMVTRGKPKTTDI
jgi:hypothetical protein